MHQQELEGTAPSCLIFAGMYQPDEYGEEIEGDDDRNDGMNALVSLLAPKVLEPAMGDWL